MHIFVIVGLLFASRADSKPVQHTKRYDLDCNGTPDWCHVDGATAYCMRGDGSWTSFPASTIITCSTAKTTTTKATTTSTMTTSTTTTVTRATVKSTTTTTTTAPIVTTTILTTARLSSTTSLTTTKTTATSPTTKSPTAMSPTTTSSTTMVSPSGTLPSPADFKADKGKKWRIELQGNLGYTGAIGSKNINGDKARTGKIGNKVIWNFGDVQCGDDYRICGFSMGPAFYGTDSVMTVNTSNVDNVQNNDFLSAWSGDTPPQSPQWAWGMDTSNVAEINSTHGVAFAWEIWRGAPDGSISDRGNAVASITLGADKPIAQRVGPLLTGPDSIALGLLAILRDGKYIYTYSVGGPSNLIIGRVSADDSVFDATKYEFLKSGTSNTWSSGIPTRSDSSFGATTANPSGKFGCDVYGSVFYNTYLKKYVILCSIYMSFVNMYTSDTPYGPWSAEYGITSSGNDGSLSGNYGAHAHPEYGTGKEWYFSTGPNGVFQVFKITFDY